MVRWLDELASAGVFTTDTSLAITSWNQWFERATGWSAAAVVGRPLFDVFPDIVARGLDRYYTAALRGEVRRARAPLSRTPGAHSDAGRRHAAEHAHRAAPCR